MKYILFLVLFSCQGYHFQKKKNPFSEYGIKTIAVENFYNFTNLSNLSSPFTKEMLVMLAAFPKLKIVNDYRKADAVLVGVLNTTDKRQNSRKRADEINATSILESRIGSSRGEYLIPTKTILYTSLNLMIIKKFSHSDVQLLKSKGQIIDPRVIISENLNLSEVYTREVLADATNNFTTTRAIGAEKNAISEMARKAASTFREMILYAF